MKATNAWASAPNDNGAIGAARPRRVRPIAAASIGAMLVAIGLPLTAMSASAVVTTPNALRAVAVDLTPPTVSAVFPAALATGTRFSDNVTATVSEPVGNVNSATFTLKNAAGTAFPAVTTFNPATKVITLNPNAALPVGTHTASIDGVIDAAGNPIVPMSWSFTTFPSQVASYIDRVYLDLFKRAPDPTGVTGWTAKLNAGTPRAEVANGITHSAEYRSRLIAQSYQKYLKRGTDPIGLRGWLAEMNRGLTFSQMEAGFIASNENWGKAGFNTARWVTKLYQDVLGRPATPEEVSGWTTRLNAGPELLRDVAMGFLLSPERLTTVVDGYYQELLGRGLDANGQASTVAFLGRGGHNESIIGGIIGGSEYYSHN